MKILNIEEKVLKNMKIIPYIKPLQFWDCFGGPWLGGPLHIDRSKSQLEFIEWFFKKPLKVWPFPHQYKLNSKIYNIFFFFCYNMAILSSSNISVHLRLPTHACYFTRACVAPLCRYCSWVWTLYIVQGTR